MPPHQFWPRYHSDGLSPVHVRFEFFSKQICNVKALICHFYKNIKTLTQIHFPRDAHIFRTCTIFCRHYKGLHQMRKDLVLWALDICGKVWMKNNIHGFTDNNLLSVKYVVFHLNFATYIVRWCCKTCVFLGFVWTDCWGNLYLQLVYDTSITYP